MSTTNCKNCGAALDIWAPKCEFCGTRNINLTAIDFSSNEPVNFIFKMPSNIKIIDKEGQEVYLSTLAVPSLEAITVKEDITSIYGGFGFTPMAQLSTGQHLEFGIKLNTVTRSSDNVMCELRVNDK